MDLLEYQAKALFREMGIPVLPSQRIDRPKDLKGLKLPYPVVLKSQVYIGGRGRVGGVKFVENTIDAVAAAQTIFNLPIMGEYPQVLLAEAKYNADREFYLAVVLNRSIRRPILLGSQQGGIDVQSAMEQMQHVVVDQEFSPFYARRLALKMGLQGSLITSVSDIIEKMYRLFLQKDLDLVEINPLGVSAAGELMALDGKVTVNDDALDRHPDLVALAKPASHSHEPVLHGPVSMDSEGMIAVLCNGAGSTMATLDLLIQSGGKPGCFLNLNGETRHDWSPDLLVQSLATGLELVTQNKQVRVVLINLISGIVPCDQLAEVIIRFLQFKYLGISVSSEGRENGLATRNPRLPCLVVRLVGPQWTRARELLNTPQVTFASSLDDAMTHTVSLARSLARGERA